MFASALEGPPEPWPAMASRPCRSRRAARGTRARQDPATRRRMGRGGSARRSPRERRVRGGVPAFQLRLFDTLPADPDRPLQCTSTTGTRRTSSCPARGTSPARHRDADRDPRYGVDLGHPDLAARSGPIRRDPRQRARRRFERARGRHQRLGLRRGDADPNPEPMFDEIGLDVGFHGTFCAGIALPRPATTRASRAPAGTAASCRSRSRTRSARSPLKRSPPRSSTRSMPAPR